MSDQIPTSINIVQKYAGGRSFSRGKNYYHRGAIANPRRIGNALSSECYGTTLYQVTLGFKDGDLSHSHCSCPYDWGGLCKHRVALWLTWINEPAAFKAVDDVASRLADKSREELILLLETAFKRQPDLLDLLEMPTTIEADAKPDLDYFQRQIKQVLNVGYDDHYDQDVPNLQPLQEMLTFAERYANQGNWPAATELYSMLAMELAPNIDRAYDIIYDEGVYDILQMAFHKLDEALRHLDPSSDLRRITLQAVLREYLNQTVSDLGSIGTDPYTILMRHYQPEYDAWLEQKLLNTLKEEEADSEGRNDTVLALLAELYAESGREAENSPLFEKYASPQTRLWHYVYTEQFDRALKLAEAHFLTSDWYTNFQFAHRLLKAGQGEQARRYIERARQHQAHDRYLDFLLGFHKEHGDPKLALEYARKIFENAPSLANYQQARTQAEAVGQWSQVRAELLGQLGDNKAELRFEIAQDEGDVEAILNVLPQLRDYTKLTAAEFLENQRPEVSLDIYQDYSTRLINRRGRDNYAEAAKYLSRVRSLYQALGEDHVWQNYIRYLRETYNNLPACQDELNRAGL